MYALIQREVPIKIIQASSLSVMTIMPKKWQSQGRVMSAPNLRKQERVWINRLQLLPSSFSCTLIDDDGFRRVV